ncbi:LIM-domain-containing protein [Atractiella rhizophila]|nr:LIM-domain-containing protein [Atractiella rhizophila]
MASKKFFVDAPKCYKCEKTVYAAEQVIGPANKKYHKSCLVCVVCSKRLDSLALLEHNGQPYCKLHHAAATLSHGPLYPTRDPNPLSRSVPASASRPSGVGAPPTRSFSKPISNEEVRRTDWAKNNPATSSQENLSLGGGWEEGTSVGNASIPSIIGTEDPEHMEEIEQVVPPDKEGEGEFDLPFALNVRGRGDSLGGLTPGTGIVRASSPAASVTSNGARSVTSVTSSGKVGGGDLCRRCGKVVYFAEEKRAVGQKWHKSCLRCASCDKSLSSHLVEKDSLPYCNQCYSKNFGNQSPNVPQNPPEPNLECKLPDIAL